MWSMSGLVRIRLAPLCGSRWRSARGGIAVVDRRRIAFVMPKRLNARAWFLGQRLVGTGYSARRCRIGAQDLERGQLKAQRLARRRARGMTVGPSNAFWTASSWCS